LIGGDEDADYAARRERSEDKPGKGSGARGARAKGTLAKVENAGVIARLVFIDERRIVREVRLARTSSSRASRDHGVGY